MTQRRINPFVAAAHAAILVWAFSVCAIEGARILGWLPLKWAFKLGVGSAIVMVAVIAVCAWLDLRRAFRRKDHAETQH